MRLRLVLGRSRLGARVFAVLAALVIGIPLALSATAGANSSRTTRIKRTQAAIDKLPAQARSAIRRDDAVRGRDYFDGLGIRPGKIRHVWLIILENKSYDATFTGLNNNTYLWKTLPSQGVLLKNYYGTGHDSLDNYLSMAAGQAPLTDTQSDCPDYDAITGSFDYSGNLHSNPNYGQLVSAAGPNAAPGQNGCVYPASVPTLFNQLERRRRELEGVRAGSGQPRRIRSGPRRRHAVLRRALRVSGIDGEHGPAEPRLGELDRPVRAQALPVPVV